ncbi:MAG: hypothetical protein Harvfovirus13_7 [Harvfovirus sp.]|uniref:RING-type domain-containing protein n=1 Tax=Harvfovirus sp. TaxID=2487768 RepID=A0A3G5A461_9VIRU|nr:MAG: hypothetical protein Harvfovirus13_7 [Harvfovirus sp.]
MNSIENDIREKLIQIIKKNYIAEFLERNNMSADNINNFSESQIVKIYDIFKGNVTPVMDDDPVVNNSIGLYYFSESDLENCEKFYLLAVEGNYSAAMFNVASLYRNQGKYDISEKYYLMGINDVKEFDENYYSAIGHLATVYGYQNKMELAEKYHLIAIESGTKISSMSMQKLGNLYCLNKKYDLAEKYLKMALDNGSDSASAGYILGTIYDEQEKFDLAEKYLLMNLAEDNIKMVHLLGNVYFKQNKYEMAEIYYLKATGMNHCDSMNNLACIYLQQSKGDLAEKYFLMAIEHGSLCAEYNLAHYYQSVEKYDFAEEYYLKSLRRDENCVDTIRNLGYLYHKTENYDLAEKFYVKGVCFNDSDCLFNLEILYEGNILKLYDTLKSFSSYSSVCENRLKELANEYVMRCFNNKKKLLSKIDHCEICFEDDVVVIPMECVHYYCLNCYVNLSKCPLCELELEVR